MSVNVEKGEAKSSKLKVALWGYPKPTQLRFKSISDFHYKPILKTGLKSVFSRVFVLFCTPSVKRIQTKHKLKVSTARFHCFYTTLRRLVSKHFVNVQMNYCPSSEL